MKILSLFKSSPKAVPEAAATAAESLSDRIQRGRALHRQGQLEPACTLYREILAEYPDSAEAHYGQANVLKDLGQFEAALSHYERAIALKPDYSYAFCNRAVILSQLQRLPEALASFERAIELDPTDVIAHCNRGGLLIALGRKDEALESFGNAIAQQQDCFPAHFNRAALLQERKDWEAALASYDRAVAANPGDVTTHYNRSSVLRELGSWDAALAGYDRAIALDPTFYRAHAGRAQVLQHLNQLSDALESYDRAIELNPREASLLSNRGALLHKMRQFESALASCDQAVAAAPEYAAAHFNRGSTLMALDQPDAALESFERAIALNPLHADAYVNRGVVQGMKGLMQASIASYRQATHIKPDLAEAYYNLALASLKIGDLTTGWGNYEWRWLAETGPIFRETRHFRQPLWLGKEPIAGRRLLLYGEQGLGDSLQFCRYVEMVAELGPRIILEVPSPLVSVSRTLRCETEVVAYGKALPDFDFQCPLMSLPLVFGTTLQTIPARTGYLRSDPEKKSAWQRKLGERSRPRIGLTWSGNQTAGTNRKRHFPLSLLEPHLSQEFEYFCLQTDITDADVATLQRCAAIRNFASELRDFSDTAALCDCMDLLISIDTSVAHLAGALGRPTWVLLAFDADWRWLIDRDDNPWYPTMRLFRQQTPGDWAGVFERVASQLQQLL